MAMMTTVMMIWTSWELWLVSLSLKFFSSRIDEFSSQGDDDDEEETPAVVGEQQKEPSEKPPTAAATDDGNSNRLRCSGVRLKLNPIFRR